LIACASGMRAHHMQHALRRSRGLGLWRRPSSTLPTGASCTT